MNKLLIFAEGSVMNTGLNISILIVFLFASLGCNPSKGSDEQTPSFDDNEKPSRQPTPDEIMRASGGGYISPDGMRRECLGRLVFDVGGSPEWPTSIGKDATYIFSSKFSENLYDAGDKIIVDNVKIAVIGPVTKRTLERIRSGTPWAVIEWDKEYIKSQTEYIERLRIEKAPSRATQKEIIESEESLAQRKLALKETMKSYEEVALPLPDSEGFWKVKESRKDWPRFSIYQVYLKRGEFVYVFESTVELTKEVTKETHKNGLVDLLNNFRPRKLNEIPTDLGICIPHGFIADRGERITDIKQSMRWPEAPGVLYSVRTANSTPKNNKAAFITAIGTAMAAKTKSVDGVKPTLTHQIGPRITKIGGLPASQGGFAMRIDERGKKSFEVYNVFTGYSGWWGTAVLPYISVEMSTRTIDQVSELKSNPPPFKESMTRLEMLLKSTHIRPTNPLMPEFAAIQQQRR
jgi:hypothetical protein